MKMVAKKIFPVIKNNQKVSRGSRGRERDVTGAVKR
jgi:hypothetical protein